MDTTSCLDAIHRFIARRGQPKTIVSDNGTNFVGAAREFKECFAELHRDEITVKLSESGIKWSFNPPTAPQLVEFGKDWYGPSKNRCLVSWESKDEGRHVANGIVHRGNFQNNHPLTHFSSDVSDLQPLTPNHFLIGQVNVNWPNALFSGSSVSYRNFFRDQHSILVAVWNR